MRPNFFKACLARLLTSPASLTSVSTASALTPMLSHSSASSSSRLLRRAARTSVSPASANLKAAARPIPLEAPVITTTRPSSSCFISVLRLFGLLRKDEFRGGQDGYPERKKPGLSRACQEEDTYFLG